MKKVRVQTLLDADTIKILEQEAKEKQITLSAVIRQKIAKAMFKDVVVKEMNKTDVEFGTGKN